jgi:DNA mismatch endonuclease, patch repair protein
MNPSTLSKIDYPHPSSPAASAIMRANRKTDTRPELRLRAALHRLGYRYRVDHPIRTASMLVRPDVVFTRRRVAVFVDGCFWHACPQHGNSPRTNSEYWREKLERNRQRDVATTAALTAAGWRVVRVWEHLSEGDAVDVITAVVGPPAAR